MELTSDDIAKLRYAAEHRGSFAPGVRYKRVLLVAGPLDGVPTRVDADLQPGASMGWTTHTDKGVVTTMYLLGDDHVWRFSGFEWPGTSARITLKGNE